MNTQITPLEIFLWLSNTDPKLFVKLPASARWNRIGLSLFVLLTGIFAFLSGSFFVRTMFAYHDEFTKTTQVSTTGWIVSVLIGLIWMVFIVNLDRMIVSSRNKLMAVLRIPLAIAIGLIIAIPFEIQLFKERITKALVEANRMENAVYEDRFNNFVESNNQEVKRLKALVAEEQKEMSYWRSVMEAETAGRVKAGRTGIPGRGPAYHEAKENYELHKSFYEEAQSQLLTIQTSMHDQKESAYAAYRQNKIEQSYDFASQYEAFAILKEKPENKSLKNLALFITLLFVLIEITPALMKLFAETDAYDQLLISRSHIDEQAVNVLTNYYMEKILIEKQKILDQTNSELQPKNSFIKIGNTLN